MNLKQPPLVLSATLALSSSVFTPQVQTPTFRATSRTVVVYASVVRDGRPATGLTAADFELTDDGVRQTVDDATIERFGSDVSLLLDVSQSAMSIFRSQMVNAVNITRGLLTADDRARLLMFDGNIQQRLSLDDQSTQLLKPFGDGGTSLIDAISIAVLQPSDPLRRHVVIVLTDGIDTSSVLSQKSLIALLKRSNAVVHLFAFSMRGRTNAFEVNSPSPTGLKREVTRQTVGDYDYLLREIAEESGGRFHDIRPNSVLDDSIREAVENFRTRYTLRYSPRTVGPSGWHQLVVSIRKRGYTVHAKKGYFWD